MIAEKHLEKHPVRPARRQAQSREWKEKEENASYRVEACPVRQPWNELLKFQHEEVLTTPFVHKNFLRKSVFVVRAHVVKLPPDEPGKLRVRLQTGSIRISVVCEVYMNLKYDTCIVQNDDNDVPYAVMLDVYCSGSGRIIS